MTVEKEVGWLEKEVYSVEESGVEELQSCRCPHCGKILTTPYMYYFTDFPYCPSCGKKVGANGSNQSK